MSYFFVDIGRRLSTATFDDMANALSFRVRAMIINYHSSQPDSLSVTEFCRSLKVSRSVFYKIRDRSK